MNKIILNKDINTSSIFKIWPVLMGCIFLLNQCLFAQSKPTPEYHIKAAFLLNFTRFIDWPSTAFSTPNAPFVIAVLGNDPFGSYIEELLKDEKAGAHPIIIRRYKNVQEIGNCHILFINPNKSVGIHETLKLTGGRSILTVSDVDNFAKMGGVIRFYNEHNKIKLEINTASAKAAQLVFSSKLLSLAKIVESGRN